MRIHSRLANPEAHYSLAAASSSAAAATDAAISEGRSIQANVGVELKGVRWS